MRFEVARAHGRAIESVCDNYLGQPSFQVIYAIRQAENRHYFRSDGDVEAILPRHSVRLAAKADHGVAEGPVVHVQHPPENYLARVHAQRVSLLD